MSGPLSNPFMFKSSAAVDNFYDHQIANSMRFAGVQDLDRSRSSAGSTTTSSISFWVKRNKLSAYQYILHAYADGNNYVRMTFLSDDTLEFQGEVGGAMKFELETTQVFRDTSAWYHIVGILDFTNGTQGNRAQLYVNGERVTAFDTETYPADASQTNVLCGDNTIRYGDDATNSYILYSYLAEIVLIDGTAQAVGDFGETKNGVWIPKDPSGLTFGTTGHYLKFESSSDLGNDSSGNNNDFTPYELTGAHDQMLDSPTFGSSNGGNYATYLGKLIRASGYSFTMSEGNLKHTSTSGNNDHNMFSNMGAASGKWYAEFLIEDNGDEEYVGIATSETVSFDNSGDFANSSAPGAMSYLSTGNKRQNGSDTSSGYDTYTTGDIISVAMDIDNTKVYFAKNGTWQDSGNPATATNPAYTNWVTAGSVNSAYLTWHFATCIGNNGDIIANFGQDGTFAGEKTAQGNKDGSGYGNFYYAPPSGFLAMCAGNLPIPAAIDPAETDDNYPQKLFGTLKYTGNNSERTIDTTFQIDLSWLRSSVQGQNWYVFDTSRGFFGASSNNYYIKLDDTGPQAQAPQYNWKAQSGSNITLTGGTWFNSGSHTQHMWNWRANGGTTTTDTSGDIDGVYQTNDCGFSILQYTGNGTSNSTVPHGVTVGGVATAPDFTIIKNLPDSSNNWRIWCRARDNAAVTSYAEITDGAWLASQAQDDSLYRAAPTSTMLTLTSYAAVNSSSDAYIAYNFANVPGFIQSGVYSGTGRVDGGFCYTGFEPVFLFVKAVASGNDWVQYDTLSDPDNPADNVMYLNDNAAITSGSSFTIDILSNGWKARTTNSELNADTADMVYFAMAKNPFKYATAR